MNAVQEAVRHIRSQPTKMALWTVDQGEHSFSEMGGRVVRTQAELRASGVGPGSAVLLLDFPGAGMFSSVIAILGLGATCILVEPWLPVAQIDHVVRQVKPQVFIANWFGRLWGLRVPSVRSIPHWIGAGKLRKLSAVAGGAASIHLEAVDSAAPAMITFSSGTSGKPKGIVRGHGYLNELHSILTEQGRRDPYPEPDLSVFPNIGLFHLSTGRGALLVPHSWKRTALNRLAAASEQYRPATLSCGPAFLRELRNVPGFSSLKTMYVGGALSDCAILESAFSRWQETQIHHIYGGTEAEPVALGDARQCVRRSREAGFFQVLNLGRPIDAVTCRLEPEGAWVSGANVCPEYIDAPEENRLLKHRDQSGRLWHFMGDRLKRDGDELWYAGRSFQREYDFELEQKIYAYLGSSKSFLVPRPDGTLMLCGEELDSKASELKSIFPAVTEVRKTEIVRDRRHRARIDRVQSLRKGGIV